MPLEQPVINTVFNGLFACLSRPGFMAQAYPIIGGQTLANKVVAVVVRRNI